MTPFIFQVALNKINKNKMKIQVSTYMFNFFRNNNLKKQLKNENNKNNNK